MYSSVDSLTKKFGELMTLKDLAVLLDRSPDGIRMSLSRDSEFSRVIKKARRKIGRRVYFNTAEIAESIVDGPSYE